jgi:hypothetical protein
MNPWWIQWLDLTLLGPKGGHWQSHNLPGGGEHWEE